MILEVNRGLVEIVLEPQYQGLATFPLLTVRASDLETFEFLNIYPHGDFLMDFRDQMFPLTAFVYERELLDLAGIRLNLAEVESDRDLTKPCKAFRWVRWVNALKPITHEGDYQSECVLGYCLPNELAKDRQIYSTFDDEFCVYPLHVIPDQIDMVTTYEWDRLEHRDWRLDG